MDVTKWKSIAVSIEVYDQLKKRAAKNDRSVSRELMHIVKQRLEEDAKAA